MAVWSSVVRFGAIDKFSAVLAKMEDRNRRFAASSSSSFRKVEADAMRLKDRIGGIGSQLKSMVAVVSIGAMFASAGQAVLQYESSLASLSAVTGVTGEALAQMDVMVQETARKTKRSAAEIAGSYEIVGSAMSQYLNDPAALRQITEAGILLAKASKMETEPALRSLTGAMNQFNLGAEKAEKTVNMLTAGEIVGQVSTEKSVDALSKFGAVANSMNTTLPESIALIQVLGKKLPTEEIGTASRNLLLFMDTSKGASQEALKAFERNGVSLEVLSNKSLSTADRLRELSKVQNDSVAMSKIFGKENITAGKVIFEQLDTYEDWVGQISKTEAAQEQAAKNTATVASRLGELKTAFDNAVVSQASGSVGMTMFNNVLEFAANNMDLVIGLIAGLAAVLIPAYVAYKLIAAATLAWNIGLGIQALILGKGAMALKGNVIALKAYAAITRIVTAAQWAWNVAMSANPIGLIIAAIIAAIAIIVLLVKHWDTLKEKFLAAPTWVKAIIAPFMLAMAPALALVNLIRKLVNAWDGIKAAFSEGGIAAGFKKLGGVLISALIDPLVFFLKLLAKIPGIGSAIDPLIEKISSFQANAEGGFGTDDQLAQNRQPINTQATQNTVQSTLIQENKQSVDININDPKQRTQVNSTPGAVPVKVNGTTNRF